MTTPAQITSPSSPVSPSSPRACRPREAAKLMGLSKSKVDKMIGKGELRSVKVGWARLVPMDAIEDVLKGRDASGRD